MSVRRLAAALGLAIVLTCVPAEAAPAVSRQALSDFREAVAPLAEEARALDVEVQRALQRPRRRAPLPTAEQVDDGLRALRKANRELARVEALIARADALSPPPALRLPAIELLLGVQHVVLAARNLQLHAMTLRPDYLEAARQHQADAQAVIAAYRAHLREIEREVTP